jgi:hypothetical protein
LKSGKSRELFLVSDDVKNEMITEIKYYKEKFAYEQGYPLKPSLLYGRTMWDFHLLRCHSLHNRIPKLFFTALLTRAFRLLCTLARALPAPSAISALAVEPRVARTPQRHAVGLVIHSAFLHRNDVVGYGRLGDQTFILADLAEGMLGEVCTADATPVRAIALGIARASDAALTVLVREPIEAARLFRNFTNDICYRGQDLGGFVHGSEIPNRRERVRLAFCEFLDSCGRQLHLKLAPDIEHQDDYFNR